MVAEVCPWQRCQGSNPQRLHVSTRRCQSLTAPWISNRRGPAHKTNTFVPNEYREVVKYAYAGFPAVHRRTYCAGGSPEKGLRAVQAGARPCQEEARGEGR